MAQRSELGEFLLSRRNRLRPEDAGLTGFGARRRVPGLRREEIAHLAGVSAAYYTRLEQGQNRNASPAVLDALARALQLNDDEKVHLANLARPSRKNDAGSRQERVRPGVRQLIESFDRVPAVVLGRVTDVLAWNPLAHALLTGHLSADSPLRPVEKPNMARLVFLDEQAHWLYSNWTAESRDLVALLRMVAGRYADDPKLASLVGELSVKSSEFAGLWSSHPVRDKTHGVREFRHPVVGELTLSFEALPLPDSEDQRVITYHAKPGSPSADALARLAEFAATLSPVAETAAPATASVVS
ncbi:helix-turn-helix domain-containing protein [Amycolatopsis sp. H20-H5]|uniref:helix-turn-helix domain-containing protein n=1 Tax=Amycolatopsis sp. H20-H5 TaxID=3046309 RepID=UPI002DBBFA0A|nr:helix-turn-helix transcriptional regulator [Amycolatopsis sp. H20-H5]MEC3977530.1 helix-turn-helix transcriptional regulator [Amycolatopsis sp. H20-H5]